METSSKTWRPGLPARTHLRAVLTRWRVRAGGLNATNPDDYFWTQTLTGHGGSESYDEFGFAVACGDFNGDSLDDFAVGVPFEDVNGYSSAGAVNWIRGAGSGGLGSGGGGVLWQGTGGLGR